MTVDPLSGVRSAARKAAAAHRVLEAEVRMARASGQSLRAIAEAAGVSYETVRRIAGA